MTPALFAAGLLLIAASAGCSSESEPSASQSGAATNSTGGQTNTGTSNGERGQLSGKTAAMRMAPVNRAVVGRMVTETDASTLDDDVLRVIAERALPVEELPDDSERRRQLADALFINGALPDALRHARQALNADPSNPRAAYTLAMCEDRAGDRSAALEAMNSAVRNAAADSVWLRERRGFWLLDEGDIGGASADFDAALEAKPRRVPARIGKARVMLERDQLGPADQLMTTVMRDAPGNRYARFVRGEILRRLGQREAAAIELEAGRGAVLEWAAHDPWLTDIQRSWRGLAADIARAKALLGANRPDDAIKQIRLRVGTENDAPARIVLASAHAMAGRLPAAIRTLEDGVETQPDEMALHLNLAGMLSRVNRMEESLAAYDRAIELQPGTFAAHFGRAQMLVRMNRLEDAASAVSTARGLNPKAEQVWTLQAGIEAERGEVDAARVILEQAIEEFPRSVPARLLLARLHRGQGNTSDARRVAQEAASIAPGNAAVARLLKELGP